MVNDVGCSPALVGHEQIAGFVVERVGWSRASADRVGWSEERWASVRISSWIVARHGVSSHAHQREAVAVADAVVLQTNAVVRVRVCAQVSSMPVDMQQRVFNFDHDVRAW